MLASALFHGGMQQKSGCASSANEINVDADISEPIRRTKTIFLLSKYFICAILLNIYRPLQRKLSRSIVSRILFPPSGIYEMKASMSHFDANFVSDFHQSRHRLTWHSANESVFEPMYCAAYSKTTGSKAILPQKTFGAAIEFLEANNYEQKMFKDKKSYSWYLEKF